MILKPAQFDEHRRQLGSKALNLKRLMELDLNVPEFVAITSDQIADIYRMPEDGKKQTFLSLAEEIKKQLPVERYIVRSGSLSEDGEKSSNAGQFLTLPDQKPEKLPQALAEVLHHGVIKLQEQAFLFSIIIQRYIPADYSGVCFTRNPLGGREMIVEYHQGAGEAVVSGRVKPLAFKCFWTGQSPAFPVAGFNELIAEAKRIEEYFNFPQDIEWCIKNGRCYFLQSRPITSLDKKDHDQFLYLDKVLSDKPFYYEKTEISEISPRPTPLTLGILGEIYRPKGPVDETYKSFGIRYRHQDFLTIVGNELYIDREREVKTLMPAYSFLAGSTNKLHLNSFRGLFASLYNAWRLYRLPLGKEEDLREQVRQKLESAEYPENFESALRNFLKDYRLIFKINLFAQKALKQLELSARRFGLNTAELLSCQMKTYAADLNPPQNLLGNSLDIADETPFAARVKLEQNTSCTLPGFSAWKQSYLEPFIAKAQNFDRIREFGRWLTVKNTNLMRQTILRIAQDLKFSDPKDIFFATLDEIKRNQIDRESCAIRRQTYENFQKFQLPGVLTNLPLKREPGQPLGVSAGQATAILATAEQAVHTGWPVIIYTKTLSPDLTELFPKASGIISEQGGLLSHLSIMAREHHLPVITNANLSHLNIKPGDKIFMDGGSGIIKKI